MQNLVSRWILNIFLTKYYYISLISSFSLIQIFLQLIDAWTSTTRQSVQKKKQAWHFRSGDMGGWSSTNLQYSPDYNLKSCNCLVLSRFSLDSFNKLTQTLIHYLKSGLLLTVCPWYTELPHQNKAPCYLLKAKDRTYTIWLNHKHLHKIVFFSVL